MGNFEDGDLVLMGPDIPHIWQNDGIFLRKKKDYRVKATVVYFPANFFVNITEEQNILNVTQDLIKRSSRGLRFFGDTHKKLTGILSGIPEEGFKKITVFIEAIEILCHSEEFEFLASISYKNLYDEKDTSRINTVYKFLMQNFHRNITLEEVAALCNMTPNSFCRFFKSRTKKSVNQFLNELRIGHACKLLTNENYSISDVCYESGYNNLTNFNKFFKSIVKKTPSTYRKLIFRI
jgi:AraC-like DNA-binding protein